MTEELQVEISYNEIEAEFEGEYDKVWKGVNKTLNKIKGELGAEGGKSAVVVKDKDIDTIIQDLVRNGYFDEPRKSSDVDSRIRELGKTNHGDKAASMALKRVAENGGVVRKKKSFFNMPMSLQHTT
jgi:hypothetical protein